jgi:mono/diheme cytochrome c family protein
MAGFQRKMQDSLFKIFLQTTQQNGLAKLDHSALMRRAITGVLGVFWLTFPAGCSKPPEPESQTRVKSHVDASVGEQIFQTRCFVCHGRTGIGDGPSAQGLGTPVRDLTAADWQNSITDESIGKVIRNGAKAIGGNAAMPPNPDLSNAQVQSLTQYIRELRKK